MEPKFQLLTRQFASEDESEVPKCPKYLNGHRLPENVRIRCSAEWTGVALEELDPFYRKEKTFVVIGRGSHILYRFDGADSYNANEGGWRSQAISILTHGVFNYAMLCVVILNIFLMFSYPLKASDGSEANRELVIVLAELAFLLVYIVEFVLKVISRGIHQLNHNFSCLNMSWIWLDIFIITTGIVMCFGLSSNLLYSLIGFRALKLIPLAPLLLAGWDNVISKCFRGLLPVLYYVAVIMYMLGILGLQLYMGAMETRCVKNSDSDLSTSNEAWHDYVYDVANWWKPEDAEKLCGNVTNSQLCPAGYTCLQVGKNPENDYILFDNFYLAELQTLQMVFQDYKESICEKIWATMGFSTSWLYLLVSLLFGTFSMGAFVYGTLGNVLQKEFAESNDAGSELDFGAHHERMRSWNLTKLRDGAAVVVDHKIFEIFITIIIVVDVCICGMGHFEMQDSKPELFNVLQILDKVIQGVYVLECIVKLIALGFPSYFNKGINRFDCFIVVLLILNLFLETYIGPLLKLRVLKLVPRWSALGFIFRVMYRSCLNTSTHLFGLLGIVIIVLAIFAFANFSQHYVEKVDKFPNETLPRWNTVSVWNSAKLVLRTFCGEWIEVLWDLFLISDWLLPCVFILTSFLSGNLLITLTGVTIILTTKSLLESDQEAPPTPFEQVFFPITWISSKIRGLICVNSPATKTGQSNDVEQAENQESAPKETSRIQEILRPIVDHKLFGVLTIIVLLLASFSLSSPKNEAEVALDIIFLMYFVLEIGLRIVAGRGILITHVLDVLILLDTLLTLILADSRNHHGYLYLRSFRLLMLISRVERIKAVLYGLCQQLCFAAKYILGIFYIWLTFSIIGVSLFSGQFHKCVNHEGEALDYRHLGKNVSLTKSHCDSNINYKWDPAATNFDNVLNGLWSLYQVITFNGWLRPIQSAEDVRGINEQPHRESSPATFLYFVAFIVFGILYPFNILFGLLLSNFKAKGGPQCFATPEQFNEFEAENNEVEQSGSIPQPSNGCARKIFSFVENPFFQLGICVVIFVDTLAIATEYHRMDRTHALVVHIIHEIITLIYIVELIFKLIAWRHHYFKKWWNVLDFLVALTSLFDMIMLEAASSSISSGFIRIFRLIHLLRIEGIWKFKFSSLNSYTRALKLTFPILLNILLFYSTIFYVYAVVGTTLFRNPDHKKESRMYFETFDSSMVSLYLVGTQSGWESVYGNGIRAWHDCEESETITCGNPTLGLFYMLSFMGITFFTFVHLYLTIVVETVKQLESRDDSEHVGSEPGDAATRSPSQSDHTLQNNTDTIGLNELRDEFDFTA